MKVNNLSRFMSFTNIRKKERILRNLDTGGGM